MAPTAGMLGLPELYNIAARGPQLIRGVGFMPTPVFVPQVPVFAQGGLASLSSVARNMFKR